MSLYAIYIYICVCVLYIYMYIYLLSTINMDTLKLDLKCRAPWFFGQVAICTAAGRPARCRTAWYNLFVFTQGQMHALCLRRNKV